ncbi:methyl-accepting chemotaxis protein, partial [Burkholderia ambifaria]|nr:methyl-accepting chemotaxis protein [Burkholderia ambifaria]
APAPHAAAPATRNAAKPATDSAARASKEAPAAGGYGPRLAKGAAASPKPADKPALVRPALNGEKPALAAAGASDDDWETF